jgi:hypothetical protein
MLTLKRFGEIGGGDLGRLKAKHHFAIGGHGNPVHAPIGSPWDSIYIFRA